MKNLGALSNLQANRPSPRPEPGVSNSDSPPVASGSVVCPDRDIVRRPSRLSGRDAPDKTSIRKGLRKRGRPQYASSTGSNE
jgi:hypothetical protein